MAFQQRFRCAYLFGKKGKKKSKHFKNIYTQVNWDSVVVFPIITPKLTQALRYNEQLLKKLPNKNLRIGNLRFTTKDLRRVNDILLVNQNRSPVFLSNFLKFYQLSGLDQRGNIKFTGYYSPFIAASRTRTDKYNVPLYERPEHWEGKLPTRQAIEDAGVLNGKGLEICYVEHKKDLYNLQMQGSGYVKYDDGSTEYISYDCDNFEQNNNQDGESDEEETVEVENIPSAIVPIDKTIKQAESKVAAIEKSSSPKLNQPVDYSKLSAAEIKKIKEKLDLEADIREKAMKNTSKSSKVATKTALQSESETKVKGPAPLSDEDNEEIESEKENVPASTFVEDNIDEIDEVAIHSNPRYIFFSREQTKRVQGSGRVRLTEDYSIAVDRSVIPMGACMMASVPVIKKGTNKITQELRFVLAQDTGGKVIGKGHIDLYTGAGKAALAKAKRMNSNGQLWLLLPR